MDGYAGSLQVSSVSFGFTDPVAIGVGGGGVGVGKPMASEVTLHFNSDAGLTAFLDAVDKGTALSGASLVGASSTGGGGGPLKEDYRLNLSQVHVTSVQESAAGDGGGYDVSLAYGAFVQTVTTTNANGSSSPQITGWDFTTSRAITSLANVAAPGSSPNADIPRRRITTCWSTG